MSSTKWQSKVIHLTIALLVVALTLVLSSSPTLILAAPVVNSVTETAFGTASIDHYASMPATVDAGDLLIALFTNDKDTTVTTPLGWTALASEASGTAVRISVYYKKAAGTEGGTTVNFVTSSSEEAAAQVYRITNWHDTTPPEISAVATGTGVSPDPASLDPAGWGVTGTLWLAVAGQDRGDQAGTTAYPASYTDGISTLSASDTGSCRIHSARRELTAASEDPGVFTVPASEQWVAFTMAIRPAPRNLITSSTVGGKVTTPGEGVFPYDEGTVVGLVATPDAGYRFDEWTGNVSTIDDVYAASTNITMNGDYSITANFVRQYDLTADSTEGGSVIEPGENTFTYDEGTVVDLIASPDACYEFIDWTGDVGSIADVYAASTNITMNDNYNITANFIVQYDLAIDSTTGGNVTTPGEGLFADYDAGTVVDLVASPDAGYRFGEWTGDVGTIADVYAASTNITMNGNYSVTANFVKQYDLATNSTEGGSVTRPGEGVYPFDEGEIVDLVASPDAGYRFGEWTGDVGTIADVYAASTNITMNDNYNITANFIVQYDLAIDSTTGGNVTTPGEGLFADYDAGTVVDLVASPDAGYRFGEWTGDVGTIADVYAASTNITMNGNYSVTANFVAVYDLTVVADPETGGTATDLTNSSPYAEGAVVSIKAQAEEGREFTNWTASAGIFGNATADETTFTMPAENATVTAHFVEIPPAPEAPTVTTQAATGVTTNSSTLNMNYTVGNCTSVNVCFAYKKSADSAWSSTSWVPKSADGTYAAPLTGLTSSTEYDFKAQLEYDDTAIEGTTLRFTTTTPSSPPPSAGCFIATAAYGTPAAKQIDVLREFRDDVLLNNIVGSELVTLYYRCSPRIANVIAGNEILRTLVRGLMIDPIVWVVGSTGDVWRN
jgi:hypothetical protein